MGIPFHVIEAPDGLNGFAQSGYLQMGLSLAVSYPAETAGSPTAASTVAVSIPASANLPSNYGVFVEVGAALITYATNKTSTGFTLNLEPQISTAAIVAGTANILIVA